MSPPASMEHLQLAKPVTLPVSGLTLPNRLAKAALAEALSPAGVPTPALAAAYEQWARGGWGLVMTGNVQVDARWLGQPGDNALLDAGTGDGDGDDGEYDEAAMLAAWKPWAAACRAVAAGGASPTIVQLNHPGRQSPLGAALPRAARGGRGFFTKALAPSAVPLRLGDGLLARAASALAFGTPRAMTAPEIADVVRRFAAAARVGAAAGFDGVEVHAAHGYLLAQFLSPRTNRRADAYGGTPARRAKIVADVVRAIRAATPAGFTVGIKLNSVDHQDAAELEGAIEQLRIIVDAGIDFLEISGGSYEDPKMFASTHDDGEKTAASDRTRAREAFFLEFARAIRDKFPDVPLMVTGGFRTRQGMEAAVAEGACDLVGLGRPAVLNPSLPSNLVFNPEVKDDDARLFVKKISPPWIAGWIAPSVGAGAESKWYCARIGEMGNVRA